VGARDATGWFACWAGAAGGGGLMTPMIWTSCSSSGSLMLSGLMPPTTVTDPSPSPDDREGVTAQADDQVEGVADVEQVADAGELVDEMDIARRPVGTVSGTARSWKLLARIC
jgi:hypothetical protein